jgi:acetolactate synthase-1/2/3 large subunit
LILAGSGVRIENQIDNLRSLIEEYRIPIATAWTHDLIESDHPLFAGRPGTIGTRPGNFVLQNCDLLIVLGSRLNIRQVSYNWNDFAKKAFKIWVDIDKEELKKPFPKMDLKINSSVGLFIKNLESKLNKSNTSLQNDKWLDWIKNINSKYGVDQENFGNETDRINPYELIPKIIDKAANDAIFVCGNATACIVPFQTAKLKREQRLFSNSGSASMGYDLPAAIGASIANPDKQVICFAGDGSLMMNIQELQTLKKLNCNVKVIVLDNDGYMSIKQTQNNFFGQKYGADSQSNLSFPNFSKIASAFELPTTLIDGTSWDLQISKFLATTGPGVLVAQISKNQEFTPRLKSKMSNSGMISPSLDDMFPHLSDTELHKIRASSDNWSHESN